MSNLFDFDAFGSKEKDAVLLNDTNSGVHKIQTKIKFQNKLKKEAIDALIMELPLDNESLHIVSNGSFDYFTLIPKLIEMNCGICEDFWFTTWTMSHNNVIQILELFDKGIFKNIHAMTGEYFRTRESAVYHILYLGLQERGQKLFANKNHAKITLLQCGNNFYTIEGSANFTANPRIEQFVITNSQSLFNFHKEWMTKMIFKQK